MKKALSLLLMGVFTLTLVGCVEIDDTPYEVDCEEYPSHVDCIEDIDPDDPDGPGLVNVLDELPNEQIELTLWHTFGSSKTVDFQNRIDEFELLYPNIKIVLDNQGDYDTLRLNTLNALSLDITPHIVLAYPDHIASYLKADGVIALDDFIKHPTHGVDLDDYIPVYIEENSQYPGGLMYSFPFSKSTEMMVYNKDKFDANAAALEAKLGYAFPPDRPLTWAELDLIAEVMVGDGTNQCEYLFNYDSSSNFFINNVRMWGGGYTNSDGDVLVNDATTKAMLEYVQDRFETKTFVTPVAFEGIDYGSDIFVLGDICMSVGSTAGINYNIPQDGSFEVGVLPVPQYDLDNKSVVQQGPNVAIMKDTTDAERLAAWLFIKFFTTEGTVQWAIDTAYLPVTYSGFNSQEYQDFLAIDSLSNEDYYKSLASQVAFAQNSYFDFDPAFAGAYTSSDAREDAGEAMDSLYGGHSAQVVIDDMLSKSE